MGPLGIPAAITASIRASGYEFLKGLIGRAGESKAGIAKELMSSTSSEVCELWDGEKVVRLEATKPLIQELIYAEGAWYDLKKAKSKILENSKDTNTKGCESGGRDLEKQQGPGVVRDTSIAETRTSHSEEQQKGKKEKDDTGDTDDTDPPNLSLNLIPDHRSWELSAAAILGISLQLLVLTIAGLTTFYPHWKGEFSVKLFEFHCMVGGTLLLTFGLIICALVVEQSTVKRASERNEKGKQVCILWLQRGRSDSDQSYKPYILGVEQKRIRTSHLRSDASHPLLTLAGAMATLLGYIVQFIGLGGMHWPTQAAQLAVTLIMTGVRAFIRRAPPTPPLQRTLEEIPDKHEMDWLATKFREALCKDKHDTQEMPCEDKRDDRVWEMMTVESLSEFQKLDDALLTSREIEEHEREKKLAEETALEKQEKWAAQIVLRRRQSLGALCGWTGPARKYAISVATAIDEVINTLTIPSGEPFRWPLDVGKKRRIWFTTEKKRDGDRWKSDFSEIEAALSLGLFGVELKTLQGKNSKNLNGEAGSSKPDWLRLDEEKVLKEKSMRLLGPNTTASRRDLLWWCGPGNGKLKEVWLLGDGDVLKVKRHWIAGFGDFVLGPGENEDKLEFRHKMLISICIHRVASRQFQMLIWDSCMLSICFQLSYGLSPRK